ncbi:unnamed protein product [Protopolystoma xenopodis]|uniref:ArsA/GET3 Anion-transporting ATPase-like domain-containing protein n=1 Tax=Protopolystoma xenopodis TaxID=117903 RepID=A0A3S5A900_9PLAT|nr:unnamed protein product [Protopolystoma xenopodis]
MPYILQFAPFLTQIMSFLGVNSMQEIDVASMLESYLPVVRKITEQFKDPSKTTFVCVCIPEFLSMYETERLVQELTAQEIDVHNIIINQLLFPKPILDAEGNPIPEHIDDEPRSSCRMCLARERIQTKYLGQILELYEDMHVMQLPLLEEEVRGFDQVRNFSEHLMKPFRR